VKFKIRLPGFRDNNALAIATTTPSFQFWRFGPAVNGKQLVVQLRGVDAMISFS
jgi:hypothetical protein